MALLTNMKSINSRTMMVSPGGIRVCYLKSVLMIELTRKRASAVFLYPYSESATTPFFLVWPLFFGQKRR